MPPQIQVVSWPALVLGLLHWGLSAVLWVAILVAGIVRWQDVRGALKPGVILGLLVLALSVPGVVAGFVFLDLGSVLPPMLSELHSYLAILILVSGVVSLLIGVAHTVLRVGLAELATGERSAFPLLFQRAGACRGWLLAAAAGVLASLLSYAAFSLGGVKAGFAFELAKTLYPALFERPRAFAFLVFGPTLLAAAVSEEILYRGVIQAWLLRWLGQGRGAAFGAIAVSAAFWALGHTANATPMLPKLIQVLALGFAFGAIARRYSVEASIVAHLTLNATAIGLGLALGW